MSIFGNDYFKTMRFVMAVMKLVAEIFGDKEDAQNAAEDAKTHPKG